MNELDKFILEFRKRLRAKPKNEVIKDIKEVSKSKYDSPSWNDYVNSLTDNLNIKDGFTDYLSQINKSKEYTLDLDIFHTSTTAESLEKYGQYKPDFLIEFQNKSLTSIEIKSAESKGFDIEEIINRFYDTTILGSPKLDEPSPWGDCPKMEEPPIWSEYEFLHEDISIQNAFAPDFEANYFKRLLDDHIHKLIFGENIESQVATETEKSNKQFAMAA